MDIISIRDVCQKLDISRPTLLRLRKAGKFIPEIQLGPRRIFFLARDFDAFLIASAKLNTPSQAEHPLKVSEGRGCARPSSSGR